MSMTDDQLVQSYISGNSEAFDVLLDRYKDNLFAYISYVTRRRDVAEDIFQETFTRAICTIQRGSYNNCGKFGSWIMRIAHNLLIDFFRDEKQGMIISNDSVEADLLNDSRLSDSTIESQLVNTQIMADVRNMVSSLPDTQREVVFMHYYQDLSFKDIAEITGVSINTALGRMRYALLNLRRMAKEHDIALTLA